MGNPFFGVLLWFLLWILRSVQDPCFQNLCRVTRIGMVDKTVIFCKKEGSKSMSLWTFSDVDRSLTYSGCETNHERPFSSYHFKNWTIDCDFLATSLPHIHPSSSYVRSLGKLLLLASRWPLLVLRRRCQPPPWTCRPRQSSSWGCGPGRKNRWGARDGKVGIFFRGRSIRQWSSKFRWICKELLGENLSPLKLLDRRLITFSHYQSLVVSTSSCSSHSARFSTAPQQKVDTPPLQHSAPPVLLPSSRRWLHNQFTQIGSSIFFLYFVFLSQPVPALLPLPTSVKCQNLKCEQARCL